MSPQRSITRIYVLVAMLISGSSLLPAQAQEARQSRPTWWIGASGAANLDFYTGSSQVMNERVSTRLPFQDGFGGGYYFAVFGEYRPDPVWGGMLHVGYDDRRGNFNDVTLPDPSARRATLTTEIRYVTIEPTLRIRPFESGLYLFAGPRVAFMLSANTESRFTYTEKTTPEFVAKGNISDIHMTVYSLQVGAGFDIPITSLTKRTQVAISPFISYQPRFGQKPRSVENWNLSTLRIGASIKWGSGYRETQVPDPVATIPVPEDRDITFSMRAPTAVPIQRRVRETLPMRNYVFFDEGSTEIPARYVLLDRAEAREFTEAQLQEVQPRTTYGRSGRQLTVYHNVINVLGYRMRLNPTATVTLVGASETGVDDGRELARSIKMYLVNVFDIDGDRIVTEGRDKPVVPSERVGGTMELPLLRAEDRRVNIESSSPELLLQVGGPSGVLKPVSIITVIEDPLDSHVLFTVAGSTEVLESWSLAVKDRAANVQHFGPFTSNRETVPGRIILRNNVEGDYDVTMTAMTRRGRTIVRTGSVHLIRRDVAKAEGLRFSILFGFDKSRSIDSYEQFLVEKVAPLIADGSTVIIHGHTDVVGEDGYNMILSTGRAEEARRILHGSLVQTGKNNVAFSVMGFGEKTSLAPFDNDLPEGRFYNRTVIIDIIPE